MGRGTAGVGTQQFTPQTTAQASEPPLGSDRPMMISVRQASKVYKVYAPAGGSPVGVGAAAAAAPAALGRTRRHLRHPRWRSRGYHRPERCRENDPTAPHLRRGSIRRRLHPSRRLAPDHSGVGNRLPPRSSLDARTSIWAARYLASAGATLMRDSTRSPPLPSLATTWNSRSRPTRWGCRPG